MTSPTDDEARALVEHTEYLADFYSNHGAYHSDKEVAEGFRSAATMLSRLLAERAEARDALGKLIANNRRGVTGAEARKAWIAANDALTALGGE